MKNELNPKQPHWPSIRKIFVRGLLGILPLALSLYVIVWFITFFSHMLNTLFFWILPQNIPGLGILLGIGMIFGAGVILSSPMLANFFGYLELPFKNMPLIKSIYSAFKDLMMYFSKEGGAKDSQVVVVCHPASGVQVIGLLTRSDLSDLPPELSEREERVAVFIPMSYALGGYTVFVPKDWVRRTNLKVEKAMKSSLTAWIKER